MSSESQLEGKASIGMKEQSCIVKVDARQDEHLMGGFNLGQPAKLPAQPAHLLHVEAGQLLLKSNPGHRPLKPLLCLLHAQPWKILQQRPTFSTSTAGAWETKCSLARPLV